MKLSGLACFAAGYLVARRAPRRQRTGPRPPTATLTGVPDRRRRPQEGIVAEAAIVARLLRLRLLTLDATVLFSPALVTTPTLARPTAASSPRYGGGSAASARPTPVGRSLAEAVRALEDGAAMLAEARRLDAQPDRAPAASADRAT